MRIALIFFCLMTFLVSCEQSSNETENTAVANQDTAKTDTALNLQSYSNKLKILVKNIDGDFRGISLGDDANKVKKTEDTSDIQEEGSNYIEYMINYAPLENAEVRYLLDADFSVSKIEVNIYPKSKASQDSLFRELEGYINGKYNMDSSGPGSNSIKKWELPLSNLLILLNKMDTEKIHDISLIFNYLNRQSALKKN
ncbi:MAG: hypothetical protein K2X86_03810 [Cytophagaceae bacterium]|nr:hypothetical protein [Cytophagaceae bacterium]